MIKKWLLTSVSLIITLVLAAQVNMTLQVPPSGVLLKSQLWNILLVSGGNGNQLVTVNLSLQDAQTSQVLMSASSRLITLNRGTTQLKSESLSPIQYTYYSAIFNNDRDPNGMLPAGSYIACYTLKGDHATTLAENCINLNIEALSPPLLHLPDNETVLQTPYPHFSWLPPTPPGLFSDLNYDFGIVEVLPGQSSSEAVQNNVPVFNAGRVRDMFYNYPASNKQLDTGRLYAWRIVARNAGTAVGFSEIWTFRISNPPALPTSALNSYVLLRKTGELSGLYDVNREALAIKYYSYDSDHETLIKFLDESNGVVKEIPKKVVYGTNYFVCKLDNSFKIGKVYTIELSDNNNVKYRASIRIK